MQVAQPNAKVFFSSSSLEMKDYIPIFHRWIQQKAVEELLIDVHNYSHVPDGPGIILVAHESYHCIDRSAGELGLWYRRRRGGPVDVEEGLKAALKSALTASLLLQQHSDNKVVFSGARVQLGFEDRLRAPNDAKGFDALAPTLGKLGEQLFGAPVTLRQGSDVRACFAVELNAGDEQPLEALLARL